MANRWYVALNGEELGPMTDTGLERMIQGGRIEGDTLVRNGAGSEWLRASDAEAILAARPARQRPGDAAIQAAIQSKMAVARPPSPPPAERPSPTAEDLADVLPAPEDLPAPVESAAETAMAGSASPSPFPDQPSAPALPPASTFRSPLVSIALGVGSVLILAASFAAGWIATRSLSSGAAPAPASAAASSMASAQLTALEEETRRLADEVAEAKRKLEQGKKELPGSADNVPP